MNLIQYDSNRIGTPDLLKGFAVLFMIQVHLMEFFAKQEISDSLIGKISMFLGGPPAAPLFMAVMGYFIAKSKKELSYNLKRGILLFAGGLLLNVGLNFNILLKIYNGTYNINPLHYIFGVDILLLAGMSIIVISMLRPVLNIHPVIPLIISFAVVVLGGLLPVFSSGNYDFLSIVNSFLYSNYSWSYFPLLPWLSYPLIGFAFYTLRFYTPGFIRLNKHIRILIVIIWLLFVFISRDYAFGITFDLNTYYHHDVQFFFWTIIFLAGFAFFSSSIEKYYGTKTILTYIKWLGENVTAAYVFQWLIIGNITTEIYKTQNGIQLLLWYPGIVLLVTALIIFWKRDKTGLKKLLFSKTYS